MQRVVAINGYTLGANLPIFITGEIGINHNGDLNLAKVLIDCAINAGCNAVKFQKRNPLKCVPANHRDVLQDTPWGEISYIEYKERLELDEEAYNEINNYCRQRSIQWFASCWDEESIEFIAKFDPPCYKVPSAMLANDALLQAARSKGRPIILSTGMSSLEQVDHAVSVVGLEDLVLLQCTSSYPTKLEELNLRVIEGYRARYDCPIGYSGHGADIETTLAAAALGACYVERHITLNRNMWGSDHCASLEPIELKQLVKSIRLVEIALGDGAKRVYESEYEHLIRLRGKCGTISSLSR